MSIKSNLHVGPTFDPQKYNELDEEAHKDYDEDNRKRCLPLRMKKFNFRATAKKIAYFGKSLMLRIRKQQTPQEHPNSADASQQSVIVPVSSAALVSEAADDTDVKQVELIPIEKGHVLRMVQLLERQFKGAKVSEKREDEQSSSVAGAPMTTQVDPPSPADVQDSSSPDSELAHKSSKKSSGVSAPSTPSDKMTEQKAAATSEVTPPVSEKRESGQSSSTAGTPMTTQVDPPSPADVQDSNSSESEIAPKSSKKSSGVSAPSTSSDKVTEEKAPNSEVTPPSSSEAAAGCQESNAPTSDDDVEEVSPSEAELTDEDNRHRYFHKLPKMEKRPVVEEGLVVKLGVLIEPHLVGVSSTENVGGPPLLLKSSSLTSSSADNKKEDTEKAIRIERRRERLTQKKKQREMNAARRTQVRNDDDVATKNETHSPDDDTNGSPTEDQASDDYVALRLRRREERIMNALEACLEI